MHASILKTGPADGDYEIEDAGSTNGTFVGGRRIEARRSLPSGSVLFFGAYVAVFRLLTAAELAAIEEDAEHPFAPVPTLSPQLALLCGRLRRLAKSTGELFLLGETGVGKEVLARAIHDASARTGKLMAINCAALPRELVESELFGYERGAHSTAQARKMGLIEAAEGGTLFLDELGEMPIEVQSKLLRFVQDRRFTPLGSTRIVTADVRVIAASSRTAVAKGNPNVQDALVGRLGAQPLQIPPLRERPEDIGRLAARFLRDTPDRAIESEAFQALFLYSWPRNVRELEKTILEAEVLSRGAPAIALEHLPDAVQAGVTSTSDSDAGLPGEEPEGLLGDTWNGAPLAVSTTRSRRPPPTREELLPLLKTFGGNVAEVARHLNRQYAVVWRCIQRYGINPDEYRARPAADDIDRDEP